MTQQYDYDAAIVALYNSIIAGNNMIIPGDHSVPILHALRFAKKMMEEPSDEVIMAMDDEMTVESNGEIKHIRHAYAAMLEQVLREIEP